MSQLPDTDGFGGSAHAVGDVDGDGYQDLLVQSSDVDSYRVPRSYLLHGPLEARASGAEPVAVFSDDGERSHYELRPLPPIGDVNADGYADLAFARVIENAISGGTPVVRIFFGPARGSLEAHDADAVLVPEANHHEVGQPFLVSGDFWGDDALDLLLVARREDDGLADEFSVPDAMFTERETAWGWVGPITADTYTPETADYILRIDGRIGVRPPIAVVATRCHPYEHPKDVLVVVNYESRLCDGCSYERVKTPTLTVYAWDEGDARIRMLEDHDGRVFDEAIQAQDIAPVCADFDGDGFDEIIVGAAPDEDGAGAFGVARLSRGEVREQLDVLVRGVPVDSLGWGFAVVPDLTGDGLPELAATARSSLYNGINDMPEPRVLIYTGGRPFDLEPDSVLARQPTDGESLRFGDTLAVDDLTGDGIADLVVGAVGLDGGRIFIFSGTDLRVPLPR